MEDTWRWMNREVLVTGGTGTLGREIVKSLLADESKRIKGIRIFSRDEYKQWEFRKELENLGLLKNVSFLIGDIRDLDRLEMALRGVHIVFHTAAMKQIPSCNENPLEAVQTNVTGAANIIQAAINMRVERVLNISTDKACYPINLYGATKMVAEKLFLHANTYNKTVFSCCRYGNVLGSRGSVIPLFKKQYKETEEITITHKDMTRFWITVKDVANFLISKTFKFYEGNTGVFIPKMKSCSVLFLISTLFPKAKIKTIGIRPGEKLHEVLIHKEESIYVTENDDSFFISSTPKIHGAFEYKSDNNKYLWTKEELLKIKY